MTARPKTTKDEQNQRDSITRMEVTINEVVLPTIKRVEEGISTIANKDYMTRQEASATYLTKSEFKPYAVALGTIATVALGAIAVAFFKVVLK